MTFESQPTIQPSHHGAIQFTNEPTHHRVNYPSSQLTEAFWRAVLAYFPLLSAKRFAQKLLELSEGKVVIDEEECIKRNPVCNLTDSMDDLVDKVYPNLSNYQNKEWIWEWAIMAPKNVTVNSSNTKLLNTRPGEAFM